MVDSHRGGARRSVRLAVIVATLALATTAFAGIGGASAPKRATHQGGGSEITFGLEAETTLGYCLPQSQLAISGIQVVAAVYDTLTAPNSKGKLVPNLAKSVEPNATFDEWTIGIRDGVNFHDGTPFDVNALKLNLDTYAGQNPDLGAPLFSIIIGPIFDHTEIVDDTHVTVFLKKPVHDFPSILYGTGRVGMVAPAQMASPNCASEMIGTGPFKLVEWRENERLIVEKNDDYWQKGYPKVDRITFIPVPDAAQRVTQLEGGELDMMHTDNADAIQRIQGLAGQAKAFIQKPGVREIAYYFVNAGKPPFDNPDARLAVATALNRDDINQLVNQGQFDIANGIMDKDVPGYEKNAGFPKFNLKKAKKLVASVKAETGDFTVVILTTTDTDNRREAETVANQLEKAGMDTDIQQVDQANLINQALGGNFGLFLWRNLHGGNTVHPDFDTFTWFGLTEEGSPYPTNFGRTTDPSLQELLDEGRAASDPAEIKRIYKAVNERVIKDLALIPTWYADWTIGYVNKIKFKLPKLPNGDKPLFVYGRIPVLGLSVKG